MDSNWFQEMFIDEAKPALNRHSGSGGPNSDDEAYILVDENGNEIPAVLVSEETVFDATANDIRLGKTAVTDNGVTVGTKDIPPYYTSEGIQVVMTGSEMVITQLTDGDRYDFTKFQAIVCPYTSSIAASVAADKVVIDEKVYTTQSAEVLATVTKNSDNKTVSLGISNTGTVPCLIRYITYKEEL